MRLVFLFLLFTARFEASYPWVNHFDSTTLTIVFARVHPEICPRRMPIPGQLTSLYTWITEGLDVNRRRKALNILSLLLLLSF